MDRRPIGLSIPHRKVELMPTMAELQKMIKDLEARIERLEKELEKK